MNRIRDLREDKDLKQAELGEMLGISQKTISDYEIEKTEPTKEIWIKLAQYFNVTTDYIMGNSNNPNKNEFTKGLTEKEILELENYKQYLILKRNFNIGGNNL